MITKNEIIELLKNNDKAVARAIVVLTNRQTSDEQSSEGTKYNNGRGWRPCHARMGTSMAKQIIRKGKLELSEKQIAYWRKNDRSGAMRIGIYWAQLIEEANKKSQTGIQNVATDVVLDMKIPVSVPQPIVVAMRDFGNDMERKMHLEEVLHYSKNAEEVTEVSQELNEIDEFWNKLQAKNKKQG